MNFFGVLGQLGRILPGYAEGRRQAIADNWQDISNYNQAQHGQLKNAFDIVSFEDQVKNHALFSALNQLSAQQAAGNYNLWQTVYPYMLNQAVPQYMAQTKFMEILQQLALQAFQPQPQPQPQPQLPQQAQPQPQANDPRSQLLQP